MTPARESRKWRRKIAGLSIISEVSLKHEASMRSSIRGSKLQTPKA